MKTKATARMDKPERAKRIMSTATRKAKGRKFQQWVAKQIRDTFDLPEEDVTSTSMGAGGLDVRLSAKARELFNYAVECKAQKSYGNVYAAFDQAKANKDSLIPIVCIKGNFREPLVVIEFKEFMNLVNGYNTKKQ